MRIGYYSEVLNRYFDTIDALRTAEDAALKEAQKAQKEKKEKEEAEKKAKSERAAAAKVVAEKIKKASDAREEAATALQAFLDKYDSYHYSFGSDDLKKAPTTFSLWDWFFS